MKSKHIKTLKAIYRHPISGNIKWRDIEALLMALGAEVSKRQGSRIAIVFPNQNPAVFHRPHPSPNTDKGAVAAIQKWLKTMISNPTEIRK